MAAIGSIPRGTPPGPVAVTAVGENASGVGPIIIQIYLFLVFSRLTEYVGILSNLHIILLIAPLAGIVAVTNGGLVRAASTKVGIFLTAATVWMLLAAPFSSWRGGSVSGLVGTWLKSYMTFFLVAGIVSTMGHFRKVVLSLAWATVAVLIIVRIFSFNAAADDRMMLDSGTFGNSNDLATELLLGLPFCLHVVTDTKRNFILRAFFAAVSVYLVANVLLTGSRGALLTLVLLGIFVFWKSSFASKIKLAVVFACIAAALPFALSRELKDRYLTMVMGSKLETMIADEDDLANVRSANESTEARRQLLGNALRLTLEHPVFGVGFGQFPNADADKAIAARKEPLWHEVHNVFVLLMVENGIAAVIFFLLSFFFAFGSLLRIYSRARSLPEEAEVASLSLCLLAALAVYFVCNNFSTAAYSMQFPIFGGLAAALGIMMKRRQTVGQAARAPLAAPLRPAFRPPVRALRS